jgi:hypothetical protein
MVHYLAAALLAATSFGALPGEPEWQADYGKALAATRSDQRPLLVVLDIPSDPKASLDDSLLAAEGQQAALLEAYELCHVDVSTEYGQRVAKAFGARQFPHTAIIDRTGAVVLYKKPGPMAEGEWTATLARYKAGQRTTASTAYYRGNSIMSSGYSTMTNRSYCPSCQRRAMGL